MKLREVVYLQIYMSLFSMLEIYCFVCKYVDYFLGVGLKILSIQIGEGLGSRLLLVDILMYIGILML